MSSRVIEVDAQEKHGEKPPTDDSELRFWLENAVTRHGFSDAEAAAALDIEKSLVPLLLKKHGIERGDAKKIGGKTETGALRVLPYPGGRHPRIGFLDGAIDPHRDTKFSVFTPWEGGGYIVVDFPEALWCQHGLTYLAHTHIPTIWDTRKIALERFDWRRGTRGFLESIRRLPDGLEFTARVQPHEDRVEMELYLKNGTKERMTGLRTQICVLLKGAPEFNALTNDNKTISDRIVSVRSSDGTRWVVTVWERARPWNNERCPCMHSDPVFPDLEPGDTALLRGQLFFHEGEGIDAELARRGLAKTPSAK